MPPPTLIPSSSQRYALVIDAGSSGSRLQIYAWQDPLYTQQIHASQSHSRWFSSSSSNSNSSKKNGKGKGRLDSAEDTLSRLPRVERGVKEGMGDWMWKVEPGISTLASTSPSATEILTYLKPLMDHALSSIPPSLHAATPVYLLATAGMRLLPPDIQSSLLSTTRNVLKKEYPFKVKDVRVISGEEEGLWGWVAVNYLMDGFSSHGSGKARSSSPSSVTNEAEATTSEIIPPEDLSLNSPPATYGFLDMGGASTQIAFSPSSPKTTHPHIPSTEKEDGIHSIQLKLLTGETLSWDVFSASWLGYGTNRARERYVGLRVGNWEKSGRKGTGGPEDDEEAPIFDPCLPKGLQLTETPRHATPHLTVGTHLAQPHTLLGTGSFSQCLESLLPLLEKDLPCPEQSASSGHQSSCLFGGLPVPSIDFNTQSFIGVSEYWYSSEHVFKLGGVWDVEKFEEKASEFCELDWAEIEAGVYDESLPKTGDGEVMNKEGIVTGVGRWGPKAEIPRLQMQCFKAAWLVNVLHEGLGLPRIVDEAPHQQQQLHSITNTPDGNDEAFTEIVEEKLEQKNLAPSKPPATSKGKKNSAFQSIDTVGDTSISWTLGKMVIEASKDIPPLSHPRAKFNQFGELFDDLGGMLLRTSSLGGGGSGRMSIGFTGFWLYWFVLIGFCGWMGRGIVRRRRKKLISGSGSRSPIGGVSASNGMNGGISMSSSMNGLSVLRDSMGPPSPPTTGNERGLYALSSSRNSSQVNLTNLKSRGYAMV